MLLARQSFALYRCREVLVNYGTAAPEVVWDEARAEFFARFPALREQHFFLYLGRLHEKKGCDLLLRAFAASAAARSYHLLVAGPHVDDAYLRKLQRLTTELGCADRVTFSGMLRGNLKWGAFASAEAFVLPSHQENFGIAVVEALACGTPVLISNKVNIWREIVADGCGYAEEDDVSGTRRLLRRWRETEPVARAEMGAQARRSFARRFEINQAVDSFLAAVQKPRRAP